MGNFRSGQPIWVEFRAEEVCAHFLAEGSPDEAVQVESPHAESGFIMRDVARIRFADGDLEGTTTLVRYERIRNRDEGEWWIPSSP